MDELFKELYDKTKSTAYITREIKVNLLREEKHVQESIKMIMPFNINYINYMSAIILSKLIFPNIYLYIYL